MKRCSKCKVHLPTINFTKDSSRRDGLQAVCKGCQHTHKAQNIQQMCPSCGGVFWVKVGTLYVKGPAASKLLVCSTCSRSKTSKRNAAWVGSKNPNWRGGTTSEATLFYTSKEWKALRTEVFIRDNYTCVDCGQVGRKLEANHIKPRSKHPELKLVLSNIETLCKKCHDGKKWQVYQ